MWITLKATYAGVTPLFGAGADQNTAELRLPSFKGVLRYWWRALAWRRLDGDLQAVHDAEKRLFGGPGAEGQSKVRMRLTVEEPGTCLRPGGSLPGAPAGRGGLPGAYYLGYGLMATAGKDAGRLTRGALVPPLRFTVEMRVAKTVDSQALETLLDALKALGTLGGMGARSRKGYGSLMLIRLTLADPAEGGPSGSRELWKQPETFDELRQAIATFHRNGALEKLPEYTAFSSLSRSVLVAAPVKEPLQLLNLIGQEMMHYRSWGREGKVLGAPSERRFQGDHDLMLDLKPPVTTYPKRIGFGLPHNYFFGSLAKTVGSRAASRHVRPAAAGGKGLDRRASPLFIHIHWCGTSPVGVLTFLPAWFLPPGTGVSVNGFRVPLQHDDPQVYAAVEGFLDRLLNRSQDPGNTPKEKFSRAEEVRWA